MSVADLLASLYISLIRAVLTVAMLIAEKLVDAISQSFVCCGHRLLERRQGRSGLVRQQTLRHKLDHPRVLQTPQARTYMSKRYMIECKQQRVS
jgi:hypothetical protein